MVFPGQDGLRVLLVDDDEEEFVLVRMMLSDRPGLGGDRERVRYQLEWAATYDAALAAMVAQQYDVYLVDYRLGNRDGLELLRAAQTRGCKAPIILLTGQGNYAVDLEAMKSGAADYLSKDELTAPLLERTIRYSLERKRVEEILRENQDELERRVEERTQALELAYEELTRANAALEIEYAQLEQTEEALMQAKRELEDRVAERTAQLESERARLSTIIANAPAAIVVVDRECRIVLTNPEADRIYAHPITCGENFDDQIASNIYHPDGTPYNPHNLPLNRSALHGETQVNLEQIVIWPDGRQRFLLVNSAPILDRRGQLNGAVGIFQDITHLKLAEEENLEKTTRIEVHQHLMQYRETERLHVAQELHDGPLQQLIGIHLSLNSALDLLSEENTHSETIQGILHRIQDTLKSEIKDLRLFCSELRPPTLAPFGLEKAIRSHSETLHGRNPALKVHLDLDQDGQRLPDRVRLSLFRIYQELLANVVRHARATDVWVSFELDKTRARLEVRDNGCGFEMTGRWLELARQGHLGLVGVRERAEALQGTVDFYSSPGKGTHIEVNIPL